MAALPACPDALLDENGRPRLGAYAGRMKDTLAAASRGPVAREGLERLSTEKRWHFACVATPELFVGGAIVQLGYIANAFVYVFDRRERRMLAERSFLLPPQLVEIDDLAAEARAEHAADALADAHRGLGEGRALHRRAAGRAVRGDLAALRAGAGGAHRGVLASRSRAAGWA